MSKLEQRAIVVVGSLNVDLVIRADRVPGPGETLTGNSFARYLGGKGANQAVAAAKLGAQVYMVGRVGTDVFGDDQLRSLAAVDIDTRAIGRDESEPTGVAVIHVEEEAGQNRITIVPGANNRLSADDVARWESLFSQAGVVIAQLETPLATVHKAAEMAHAAGARFVLNPAPAQPLPAALLSMVDVLTPNEHEACTLTGIAVDDQAGARRAASKLMAAGAGSVIITLGARGVYGLHKEGEFFLPAHDVQAVDTVAAGDAFTGALAVALTEGQSLAQAAAFANAAAAVAVTRPGAQPSLPSREEALAMLG